MKKLVIKMDREKILNDRIYNADKIERYIDSLFEKEALEIMPESIERDKIKIYERKTDEPEL